VCPRLPVVGDPRKSPTQFDGGRQLALLVEDGADCIGIGLGDEEHSKRMAPRRTAGKRIDPVSSRLNLLSRIKGGAAPNGDMSKSAMTDPFKSPRRRLARAREHILDIKSRQGSFFQTNPFKRVVETNSEGLREHKIKLTSELPEKITDLAYEAVEALRSTLDQALYPIATACKVTRLNLVSFPIADTPGENEKTLNNQLKGFPPEILSLLRSFKTYETGNPLIWALNRIRRQTTHRLIVPVGFVHRRGTLVFRNLQKSHITPGLRAGRELKPTWDIEKNEMIYMVASPEDHFDYNIVCFFDTVFGSTVDGVAGRQVLTFLNSGASEVDRIVTSIETEARRIGLVMTA
jgi:hypothetical protein